MSEPFLRVLGAWKQYGERTALQDVSLELHPGRITGLVGANGAGKTTLIRAIAGLLALDAGVVETNVGRRLISYLPEERGLYGRQTPLTTLTYLAELRGLARGDAAREALWWLERVELPSPGERRLEQFSKGQQQKAQLAAACMASPMVILLDEPLAGLDPLNVRLVGSLLADARARGAALLLSAHQLHLVEQWCDDVVMLDEGRVVLRQAWAGVQARGDLERAFFGRFARDGGAR